MKEIKGKVAVVTGAAMGMGRKLSEFLAADGAKVAMLDLNQKALDEAVKELRAAGAQVYPYALDITQRPQVYATADRVRKEVGAADILINNAGVVYGADFLDCPDEKFAWVMDVNVNGMAWMTKAFLPDMVAKKAGHVVNLASAGGILAVPKLSSYCASKFAVVGFSETLRMEMKKNGLPEIRFTIVCPSYVTTGMFEGVKAPMFTPWMTTEQMAGKIMKAIKKNQDYVLEPFGVKFAPLLKAILSARALDKYNIKLGVARSMDRWTGRK
ncbi:MAG: SDR family oxidoreductase [Proteobacteria bacterium]|nr:SDR family oxidoreductase [Pseudomonadota bacterium]